MIDKFLYARTTEPAHQADIESWPSLEALPHEQRDAMSSSVEAELRLQEGRLLDAMRARDIVTLSRLFDQDYVFTSAGGRVWGREQALQDFSEPGFTPERIEVELERVIPLVDAGLVTGRSRVAGAVGGAFVSGVYRFTRVWRRANDEWRILATHTSVEETLA